MPNEVVRAETERKDVSIVIPMEYVDGSVLCVDQRGRTRLVGTSPGPRYSTTSDSQSHSRVYTALYSIALARFIISIVLFEKTNGATLFQTVHTVHTQGAPRPDARAGVFCRSHRALSKVFSR